MAKRRTRLWLLPVMLAAAGFCYLDNCTVQTTFRTLRCATLPEAFSGLRIVQISDLHGRVFGKEHAALLDAVRAAKPDFIAITGDLADEDTALPSLRPLLAGLTALAPVYYVTGNHEWVISRAVRQTLCDLLDGYGVIRLENDYRVLERDGQRLVIAGVDDPDAFISGFFRSCLRQDFSIRIGDIGDKVRLDQITAVGENGISCRHLQRSDRSRTQCQGQIRRVLCHVESEFGDMLLTELCADFVQDTDRNHVFGFHQAAPHGHRAFITGIEIFRVPRLSTCLSCKGHW